MSEVPAHRLYIDGAWTDGTGDAWTEVVNPATEEVIGRVPEATQEDAERAVRAARRAFDEGPWPSMPVQDRAAVMLRMAELLERRAPELIDLNIAEVGSIRMLAEMLQVGVPLAHSGTWPSGSCPGSRGSGRCRRRPSLGWGSGRAS